MNNIIVSTSTGWNCGDDYIRQGVLAIMDLDLHRCNLLYWDRRPDSGRTHGNDQRAMLAIADAVIIAGTPEWLGKTEDLYQHAGDAGLPIAMVGVGMDGAPRGSFEADAFAYAAKNVQFAMARDEVALSCLKTFGVANAFIGPDPAFFATYNSTEARTVCWRNLWRGVDMNPPAFRFDAAIHRENELLRKAIDDLGASGKAVRVMVHDHREIIQAQKALCCDVEFFSDPIHRLYSKHYSISHRIHGLIPTLALGGAGCLRYATRKAQVVNHSIACLKEFDSDWIGTAAIQSLSRKEKEIHKPKMEAVGLGQQRAYSSLQFCRNALTERLRRTGFDRFMK